jgi:SAM-dependent methyltransferase
MSSSMMERKVSTEGVGREEDIYTSRFSRQEDEIRRASWRVLVGEYFQRFVSSNDVVVDVGAGDGLFVRNIRAKRRIAVDLSAHVHALSAEGIEVHQVAATEMFSQIGKVADVVFMSNFLEHLPDKRLLLDVLEESRRVLKPGGMILILQPNIRYVGSAYWDYIDHHIALTEYSLIEALEITGFEIVDCVPKFLPYTAKSWLGKAAGFGDPAQIMRWYLKLPLLWRIFGEQTFVVAAPFVNK